MTARRLVILGALFLIATQSTAWAEGFISPFLGVNFGGATNTRLQDAVDDNSKLDFGASFGYMSAGVIGIEEDLGYTRKFFGSGTSTTFGTNHVFTAMTNLIIGIPIGGQSGPGFRPYGLVGLGVIQQDVESFTDLIDIQRTDLAYNFGAGAMGFFADHVGMRADVRYFRTFKKGFAPSILVPTREFNFARGSVGVVFRF